LKLISIFFLLSCVSIICANDTFSEGTKVEPWAQKMVLESLDKMKKSKNFKASKIKAKKSKEKIDEAAITDKDFYLPGAIKEKVKYSKQPGKSVSLRKTYYLFISSSIPLDTLRTYIAQAEDLKKEGVKIQLIMRGWVNGMKMMKPTMRFYYRLAVKDLDSPKDGFGIIRKINLSVNPEVASGIDMVPALSDPQKKCIVYGDAMLESLIEDIEKKNCFGRKGLVYNWAEQDGIEEFKSAENKIDPKKLVNNFKEKVNRRLSNAEGANLLPSAPSTVSRKVIPVSTCPFDIPDPENEGLILYTKGSQANPLEYSKLNIKWLLFNGQNEKEIKWVKKIIKKKKYKGVKLQTLGGSYITLQKIFNKKVYTGVLTAKKNWCRATPCLIETIKDKTYLKVTEFKVDDSKKLSQSIVNN
jgi:hypothetical protein